MIRKYLAGHFGGKEVKKMQLSWYEKKVDEKDYMLFVHREVTQGWNSVSSLPCFHNGVEFIFGLGGSSDIYINGEIYSLKEGEICFINSFDRHKSLYKNGTNCYIVLISSGFFTPTNGLGTLRFPTFMERCDGFEEVRKYLDFAYSHWDKESREIKASFADTLAWLMKKYYPTLPKTEMEKSGELSLCAIRYICEHITEDITVERIAAMLGYSPNYFSTVFNQFTGMSFREYLNACRIIEYNKLKRNHPELSVSVAAEKCGFGSPNTFYRAYKKYSGLK